MAGPGPTTVCRAADPQYARERDERSDDGARPGGAYRLTTVHPPAGTIALHGVYREVVPQERLAFTWWWEGEEPERETLVTIELTSRGSETDLILRHVGFPTESARDDHVRGWTDCFDRLEVYPNATEGE